jgi:hypothetical protein
MSRPPAKSENLLVNLVCNILLPTLILIKFSDDKYLGAFRGLIVALAFPAGYGLWDFFRRRETNLLSILGFVSVLLSGGLGLLKVGGFGFAIKDAAMPTVMGLAVLLTLRTKKPLVRTMLLNEQLIDVPRVEAALAERGNRATFERLLVRASYNLALSFIISGGLSFLLARHLLKSPPGTPEFNAELGQMHIWNPIIAIVPLFGIGMFTLWKLFDQLETLTGLDSETIFKSKTEKK